jgi:hypothetical protein
VNYTELTQAIQDYCENDESTFVTNIPVFVRQAEERISRAVMLPEMRKTVTGTITSGNRYLTRPDDFLSVFSIAVVDASGDYHYLLDKDANFIREAYPDPSTTGQPKYYGIFNGDDPAIVPASEGYFILGPTPDQNYTVELYYYYDPPSIVDQNTSWYGEHAETALLYGSLVEAYTFMKGDQDIMELYRLRYDEAMRALMGVGVRSTRDDYRDGRIEQRIR